MLQNHFGGKAEHLKIYIEIEQHNYIHRYTPILGDDLQWVEVQFCCYIRRGGKDFANDIISRVYLNAKPSKRLFFFCVPHKMRLCSMMRVNDKIIHCTFN